jgi:hypothetical protein
MGKGVFGRVTDRPGLPDTGTLCDLAEDANLGGQSPHRTELTHLSK